MPELRRRDDGFWEEIPPELLDCGHRNGPLRVIVGYGSRPGDPDGPRMRTYICRECNVTTYAP